MRTIVAGLQPTIFETFAIGTPASSIRETAVCRRSWNRHFNARPRFGRLPSFLDAADRLGRVSGVNARFEDSSRAAVPLRGEYIVLGLALGKVACPKTQGCHCASVERDDSPGP